jgi:RNA polymerase sigma factor (TIGR02999 family)
LQFSGGATNPVEAPVEPSISTLIIAAGQGNRLAADALFAALYQELHRLAKRELVRRGSGVSLGATTLLHEAYLDIAGRDDLSFPDRARCGLIIDHVRNRSAAKRGGQFEIVAADTEIANTLVVDERALTGISEALDELEKIDPALAELVDLKFFCGFSFAEIAAMRGTCERTVQRKWEQARIYLHRTMRVNAAAAETDDQG